MKRTLFLVVLKIAVFQCAAQTWFNDQAEWHFAYSNVGAFIGYVHGTIGGDTVLNGQASRKLELRRFASFTGSTQVIEEEVEDRVMHYSDNVVWVYVPQISAFDTLYNMNAVPSDQWRLTELPDDSPPCGPESYMEVTDTGTTTMFGPELRWLAVDVHYSGDWTNGVIHDTIVERIGTLGMYLLPHDLCLGIVDGSEGGLPLCYRDAQIAYVWNQDIPCDRSLGARESSVMQPLQVFPNPASDHVNVFGATTLTTAVLTDLTGRAVQSWPLVPEGNALNISGIAPGRYVLRLGGTGSAYPLIIAP